MALTENQKQSRIKYAKKALKRIPLDVQKTKYDQIKEAATSVGETVNGYIKTAINERMQRQGFVFQDPEVDSPEGSTEDSTE